MARNVILLDGDAREEDKIASEALTPGELVLAAATAGEIKANDAAADADAVRAFVREQRENGGAGVDTDIASGDECTVIYPASGAVVNARIAHGEDLNDGAALESDGAGALQAHTSGRIIGYIVGDFANSTGSAALAPVLIA